MERCPWCSGKGEYGEPYSKTCDLCKGSGQVKYEGTKSIDCSACGGKGYNNRSEQLGYRTLSGQFVSEGKEKKWKERCSVCSGSGKRTVKVYSPDKSDPQGRGCYITSATLYSNELFDDHCEELVAFREFRDKWVNEHFPKSILDYYQVAPKIVTSINKSNHAALIYKEIWEKWLSKCYQLIKHGQYLEAYQLYNCMTNELKSRYV